MAAKMKRFPLLLLLLCLSGPLLVQCSYDGPPPAGSVRLSDPKAEKFVRDAKAKEARGDWKGAIKQYNKLLDYNPIDINAPAAQFRIGQLKEKTGDPIDAFEAYQHVVEKYHGSHLYEQALTRQLTMAHAAVTGQLKNKVLWLWNVNMDPTIVIKWLTTIREEAPYNDMAATTTWMLGQYLIEQDRLDEARNAYRKLAEDYPHSKYAPEAQLMVAKLWAESHIKGNRNQVNLTNAQEAYEEFLLRFPNHPEARQASLGASNMKKLLVQQQLEVGEYYYLRAKEWTPARFCFEDVVRRKDLNPEAAARAQAYLNQMNAAARNTKTAAR